MLWPESEIRSVQRTHVSGQWWLGFFGQILRFDEWKDLSLGLNLRRHCVSSLDLGGSHCQRTDNVPLSPRSIIAVRWDRGSVRAPRLKKCVRPELPDLLVQLSDPLPIRDEHG